jgi:TolB protein
MFAAVGLAAALVVGTGGGAAVGAGNVPRIAYGFKGANTNGVFVIRVDGKNRHKVSHDLRPGYGGAEPTYAPDWSGDGTRIAFGASRGFGPSKIFTVHPDGTGQQRVSSGATCFGDGRPSWSAHSNHIVFQRDECDPVEIWTVTRNGFDETQLTESPDYETGLSFRPQWSPDSDHIAFYATDVNHRISIWVMDRDGSNKRELTPGLFAEIDPQWSPDSNWIVYTKILSGSRFDPNESQICKVNVFAGAGSEICLTNSGGVDEDPHFSPGGNRIVFVSNRRGNRNVYVMDSMGDGERALTTARRLDAQPEWSPGGNWIVYVSRQGGQMDLRVVSPNGTYRRRLTNNPGVEEAPTWAPE